MIYDFIIVGAGASGCIAAITAAKRGKKVLLLEKNKTIAKKILATGNGKCNFTNSVLTESCYHGDHEWINRILADFTTEQALELFHRLGIYPYEKNGYFYPISNQAKSVVTAFEQAICGQKNITLVTDCTVLGFSKDDHFTVQTEDAQYSGRNLLLATGLLDAGGKKLSNELFDSIKACGHRFQKILPSLCGFYCEGLDFKKISGVRANARLTLLIDGTVCGEESGEVQFADYGISGIVVFQLSGPASRALADGKRVEFGIRLLPELSDEELHRELKDRYQHFKLPLNGLLPDKLSEALAKDLRSAEDAFARLTSLLVCAKKPREISFAQTCTGGILTDQVKNEDLSSKFVEGLYFAGELLDVDGICGGYNLHWAWATGERVGEMIS